MYQNYIVLSPGGLEVQQDFCNVVVAINTYYLLMLLLLKCQKIERVQAECEGKKLGPRIIDIDIILFGKQRITTKKLTIPHPHYQQRDFVLNPLVEVQHKRMVSS